MSTYITLKAGQLMRLNAGLTLNTVENVYDTSILYGWCKRLGRVIPVYFMIIWISF